MELDHFRPKALFPDLVSEYANIYYSCGPCNRAKSNRWPSDALTTMGLGFVDACHDDSATHYGLDERGELVPLTNAARYTIDACRLNRDHLRRIRAVLSAVGEFAL